MNVAKTLPEESLSVYSPAATVLLDFLEPLISFWRQPREITVPPVTVIAPSTSNVPAVIEETLFMRHFAMTTPPVILRLPLESMVSVSPERSL